MIGAWLIVFVLGALIGVTAIARRVYRRDTNDPAWKATGIRYRYRGYDQAQGRRGRDLADERARAQRSAAAIVRPTPPIPTRVRVITTDRRAS